MDESDSRLLSWPIGLCFVGWSAATARASASQAVPTSRALLTRPATSQSRKSRWFWGMWASLTTSDPAARLLGCEATRESSTKTSTASLVTLTEALLRIYWKGTV